MAPREKVFIPNVTEARWPTVAAGVFALAVAIVHHDAAVALAGVGFLLFAVLLFKIQSWFQRRDDENHPDGLDLREIERLKHDPTVSEDEFRSRSTPWNPTTAWLAQADFYIGRIRDGRARPQEPPSGPDADWDEMLDIESAVTGELTALMLGSHPDARWSRHIRRRLDDGQWRRRWPEQARLMEGATRHVESVDP